jgi:hypothetical protein
MNVINSFKFLHVWHVSYPKYTSHNFNYILQLKIRYIIAKSDIVNLTMQIVVAHWLFIVSFISVSISCILNEQKIQRSTV